MRIFPVLIALVGLLPLVPTAAPEPVPVIDSGATTLGVHYIYVPGIGYRDEETGNSYTFISPGTTVVWRFEPDPKVRSLMMSATSQLSFGSSGLNTKTWDSGLRPPGPSPDYATTFSATGFYQYTCTVHANAKGYIFVLSMA